MSTLLTIGFWLMSKIACCTFGLLNPAARSGVASTFWMTSSGLSPSGRSDCTHHPSVPLLKQSISLVMGCTKWRPKKRPLRHMCLTKLTTQPAPYQILKISHTHRAHQRQHPSPSQHNPSLCHPKVLQAPPMCRLRMLLRPPTSHKRGGKQA